MGTNDETQFVFSAEKFPKLFHGGFYSCRHWIYSTYEGVLTMIERPKYGIFNIPWAENT